MTTSPTTVQDPNCPFSIHVPVPPPLGDWSVKRLTIALMTAWSHANLPLNLRVRGVNQDHIRAEIRRRETGGRS